MRLKIVSALLVLLPPIGPATAQDISNWAPAAIQGPYEELAASKPSDAELMAAWPAAAAKKRQPGNAIAVCSADRSGAASACRVVRERPARAGFGEALVSLAPRYRLQPARP